MTLFNELQKIRAASSGGGGSLVPSVRNRAVIATQLITAASSSAISNANSSQITGSTIYSRTVNHGSGQFSTTARYYLSGPNQAQVFCQPFTVNQTTGAITVGSGSTILNTSGSIDTGQFAWSGDYVVTSHTSSAVGNTQSAIRVSGNSVAASVTSQTNSGNNNPVTNADMAYYRSGNTMYWYPAVHNGSTAMRTSWSFNGSSISNTANNNPSADISTSFTWPVAPQFGQNSPVSGYAGIRVYRTSSSFFTDILDGSGGTNSNSINMNSSYSFPTIQNQSPRPGWGLELSNGQQIFYSRNAVYRSSGNGLTILDGADIAPKRTEEGFYNDIWPVAANTWACITGTGIGSPGELVSFSVNPSTYNITIVKSVPLTSYLPISLSTGSLPSNTHISFTGSTNQYAVVSYPVGPVQHLVVVFASPF